MEIRRRKRGEKLLNIGQVLNRHFQCMVRIPRVRMGEQQEIETLINEEALLLAMFLRAERKIWVPRMTEIDFVRARQ